MLRYNYSLNSSSNIQNIPLSDMYVSKDLSFISGTTENVNICSSEDTLWVRSPYFPKDLPATITDSEVVKRNGYVEVDKTLPIYKTSGYRAFDDPEEEDGLTYEKLDIYYVEFNGDTYFSNYNPDESLYFSIDGNDYEVETSATTLTVKEKIYIENNKLTVNGITFNALINDSDELSLTDYTDQAYIYPQSWVVSSGVTKQTTILQKLTIGDNYKETIECRNINYGGHRAYIVHNEKKYYIQYFYDANGHIDGAGVNINGTEYECQALNAEPTYDDRDPSFNIYNINDYSENDNGVVVMTIDGDEYIVNFEASDIPNSSIICIETEDENLPILWNDRIIIRSIDSTVEARVKYDENDNGFVYFNARRYNVIDHLCDEVLIGNARIPIVYENNVTNPKIGDIAIADIKDGPLMYFKVNAITYGRVKLIKVSPVNGEWKELKTMVSTPSGTVYSAMTYNVESHAGIIIDDERFKIYHNDVKTTQVGEIYDEELEDFVESSGTTLDSYDYALINCPLEYRLKVINTIGSNKFLCLPDINPMFYDDISLYQLSAEILYSIQGNNFVVEKATNVFGMLNLYYDTWVSDAIANDGVISVYELSNVLNNLQLMKKRSYFTLPVGLYENTSQKMEYQDLIVNQYYDDEAEKAINVLVDMEKDMYTPRFVVDEHTKASVDSMIFNLHFRTRDLNTWKIIEDEGFGYSATTQVSPISAVTFQQGTINASTGGDDNANPLYNKRIRTTLSPTLSGPIKITANTNYKFFVFRYDINSGNYDYIVGPTNLIELNESDYKYRISVGNVNDNIGITYNSVETSETSIKAYVTNQSTSDIELACTIEAVVAYEGKLPLSANYQYCNYFITDYYPYYSYMHSEYVDLDQELHDEFVHGYINSDNGVVVTGTMHNDFHVLKRDFLYAPLKIKALGNDERFIVYVYDAKTGIYRKEKTIYSEFGQTLELTDINYWYRVVLNKAFVSGNEYYYHFESPLSQAFSPSHFGELTDNSDLLGFMYFTTDDVRGKRDKLKKSFLRLTFFDSKNQEKQNMLGTSTLYFDTDRYFNVFERNNKKRENGNISIHYELSAKSKQPDRTGGNTGMDKINPNINISPTVLTEAFIVREPMSGTPVTTLGDLLVGQSQFKLDSRIVVKDRHSSPHNSSEGFDAYILKAFADKRKSQTIYMKAEFFHAGVGIKIPMVIPTEEDEYNAISVSGWTEQKYNDFISGYDLQSVFDRLYIPINIEYDRSEKRFIYTIGEDNDYQNAIQRINNGENNLIFNLFELKIKPQ